MDLTGLYDDMPPETVGGGGLYDDDPVGWVKPDTILYRDKAIVQRVRMRETPWGLTPERDGDPVWCWCCIEGRIQKNSTFSKNWAQDNTTGGQPGMLETTVYRILAPEWHGDFYTWVFYERDWYVVDGSPVHMEHSSDMAAHWQVTMRRVTNHLFDPGIPVPVVPEGGETWGMCGSNPETC